MPLFTSIPAPFTLEDPDITVLTSTATTAGRAFFTAITLNAPISITQMRCYVSSASPTGNIDLGIYASDGGSDAPGTLLGHTGAIAATTAVFTQSLTATLTLSPGRYWLAFLDTVADSIGMRTGLAANIGVNMQTSATNLTVLPVSASTVANSIIRVGIAALRSGGWS